MNIMLFVAQISSVDVALIAGVSSVLAATLTGVISWSSNSQKNSIDRSHTLFDAYHDVVENLQNEILRLQQELTLIRQEMKRCETSNAALSKEIKKLQSCVDKLNQTESEIQTFLSIEHNPDDL
jgi:peptidoglycan hydrolase CwlO-like protein